MQREEQCITLWNLESSERSVLQVLPEQTLPIDKQLIKIEDKCFKQTNKKLKSTKCYNPDMHCGVEDSDEEPCMNVITCKKHKIYEKKSVFGRSKNLREIIRTYKKKTAIKCSKLKFRNGKVYNPDKHCGVKDSKGYPCLRTITCDVHAIAEKKRVHKRSKNLNTLLKEYTPKKPKMKPFLSNNVCTARVGIEQLLNEDVKTEEGDITSDILGKYAIVMFKK